MGPSLCFHGAPKEEKFLCCVLMCCNFLELSCAYIRAFFFIYHSSAQSQGRWPE